DWSSDVCSSDLEILLINPCQICSRPLIVHPLHTKDSFLQSPFCAFLNDSRLLCFTVFPMIPLLPPLINCRFTQSCFPNAVCLFSLWMQHSPLPNNLFHRGSSFHILPSVWM